MHAEILVIGAGTAGLRTALTAAASGAKTVLVGEGPILGVGGPFDALLHSVDAASSAGGGAVAPDFAALTGHARSVVEQGRAEALLAVGRLEGLTYLEGFARFVAPKAIEVGHERITFEKAIVATGARPASPPIPGLSEVPSLTSQDILALPTPPQHLIIIGGDRTACEYATFFAALGTRVTLLERAPHILPGMDEDLRAIISDSLESMGVRILAGVTTQRVTHNKAYTCTLSGAPVSRVSGDALLVATGRVPNTDGLGLDRAGVERDARGYIRVDELFRTSAPAIYAVGDVTGEDLSAHAARREGWLALEHALLEKRVRRPRLLPWAVFTRPVVAGFGPTEQELKRAGTAFGVLEATFGGCGRARIAGRAVGKVKVLHAGGRILGAAVVGPGAESLIHELLVLERLGDRAIAVLHDVVHIHLSFAEVLEGLKERE